jgi:hypothetical protein
MPHKAKIRDPLDLMHGRISRLGAFASHYILLPPEGTNSNDPDTWLLGFRIRFDLHFHTRFYYLLENQHGENEYDWYRLWAQSWSFGDGSCSRLSLI